MTDQKRIGSLELNEDMQFQEKEWKFERAGWVIGLILLLLALAGLFGSGPLSSAAAQDGGLLVRYDRFTRFQGQSKLEFELEPDLISEGQVSIWVDRQFLEINKVEQISPQPEHVQLLSDRIRYGFQIAEADLPEADQPVVVQFRITPERIGLVQSSAGEESQERTISFRQFVFP
ncbi:MAG: hypothetical protein GX491_22490 [Chloroflexi bacterium]|nr:hypothetical protein [Chloroflexota bacterium]